MEKGNIEKGYKAFFMKTCKTKTCEIIADNYKYRSVHEDIDRY